MSFVIDYAPACKREIKKLRLTAIAKQALADALQRIATSPKKGDAKQGDLAGTYAVAFAKTYRILYEIDDVGRRVLLLKLGHRQNFYDDYKQNRH